MGTERTRPLNRTEPERAEPSPSGPERARGSPSGLNRAGTAGRVGRRGEEKSGAPLRKRAEADKLLLKRFTCARPLP